MRVNNRDTAPLKNRVYWLWLLPPLSSCLFWLASPGGGGYWFLVAVAFVPLLFFSDKFVSQGGFCWKVFAGGFLHGLLLAFLLLYWIVNVLVTYGGVPEGISVLVLFLLASYMACYPALFLVVSRVFTSCSSFVLLFTLPSLWTGLEWVRGWIFTGFPWMDLGCYLAFQPELLQGAAFFGHYGITWLILLCNTGLWLILTGRCGRVFTVAIVALVLLYVSFSLVSWEEESVFQGENVRAGIVQGNISQDRKWDVDSQGKTVSKYISLSEKLVVDQVQPDFLVWPETALPFYPQMNPLTGRIVSFVRQYSVPLITGTPWFEIIAQAENEVLYYNAALLLRPGEKRSPLGGVALKSHLVPFGEYVPLQKFLPFLAPLVESAGNLSAGEISRPLSFVRKSGEIVRAGVLICYESVFSSLSRKWVEAGADILVNLTNDAWYGRTSAPEQTLAMTTLRAVETRRSIVRVANTGVSAFILPSGEIRQKTSLFVPVAMSSSLPLRTERTFYVRYGWLFAPFCLLFVFLSFLFIKIKAQKS